ncbi:M20 family metallopeptidase [Lacisediminihabitans changchengi]|uniref:Peptidase M20 domain-containing protein 2 n=1 Tax=Lacisediminihabitans changchengi TaxID=2787634 RepID=A0A934SNV2_9MICO|nr:M20 family metallopeptidase [Lacisediminihabitans changchengi]MBK4346280.1 M20 family metallopeptidase [Lacisediminihabitans changchengi]
MTTPPLPQLRDTMARAVSEAAPSLIELSHDIHARPELAWNETFAAERTAALLETYDFRVERGVAGTPTAFVATAGSGSMTVAFLAEYDALPGIGHGCGHNVIAATGVGAGIALAAVADSLDVTVQVIGTPAEESGGGKIRMLEAGVFDGVAASLMAHPGREEIAGTVSLGLTDLQVTFRGRESHASAAPEHGRNAADAATITQVAIGLLRQHLRAGQQVHGIVEHGGVAPNIVPAETVMHYYLRARTAEALDDLTERVLACFEAGAIGSGCTVEVEEVSARYDALEPDTDLVELYREELARAGRTAIPAAREQDFPLGSTDMGNLSRVVPSIHPVIAIDTDAYTHQPGFTAASAAPGADRAITDAAVALAGTAASALADPVIRARLAARLAGRTVPPVE